MSVFGGELTAEVQSTERLGKYSAANVPRTMEEVFSEVSSIVQSMEEEATDYGVHISAIQKLTADFLASAPGNANIGSGTHCSGVGVTSGSGGTAYTMQTSTGARTPQVHYDKTGEWPKIFKQSNGSSTQVATVKTIGRYNGAFGYTKDGDLINGNLASFSHNWVAKLIGYFDRGSMPFSGEWNLPNMVLAETEEPEQFHPDATFTFSTRPALKTTYSIVMESPTEAKVGFDVWNSNKESVARVKSTTIPKGESRTIVNVAPTPPSNGIFNVVVKDAPQGLTVKEVTSQPISF